MHEDNNGPLTNEEFSRYLDKRREKFSKRMLQRENEFYMHLVKRNERFSQQMRECDNKFYMYLAKRNKKFSKRMRQWRNESKKGILSNNNYTSHDKNKVLIWLLKIVYILSIIAIIKIYF